MKIVAVIVGRKGSKRIPGKMWQKVNGISLIEKKISQLKKTRQLLFQKIGKKYILIGLIILKIGVSVDKSGGASNTCLVR